MRHSVHQVNVWSDPAIGPGSAVPPMPPSLLYLPEGYRLGHPGPAVVVVHRWNSYSYDILPRALGESLSDAGVVTLCLTLRRRGVEGARLSLPDDDLRDIKLGIDYLASSGLTEILLVGEEVGGLSVARYQSASRDLRVKGVAIVRPVPDLPGWLSSTIGEDRYRTVARQAGVASRQMLGLDHLVDLRTRWPDGRPLLVYQYAAPWLAWWGPLADTRLSRTIETLAVPLLLVSDDERSPIDTLAGRAALSRRVETARATGEALLGRIEEWVRSLVRPASTATSMQLVSLPAVDGSVLLGVLHEPPDRSGPNGDLAIVHVRGWTSIPLGPPVSKLVPLYADRGIAGFTFELRRSGVGGDLISYFDWDLDDIDAAIDFLAGRGYRRVVLAGHSLGSIGITAYTAKRKHPAVVANVHYAPTADTPGWVQTGLGDDRYREAVDLARRAIQDGRGDDTLIDVQFRDQLADEFRRPVRVPKRAAPWLSWWGPESDSVNSRLIGDVETPILLLCGSEDNYNDRERLNRLQAMAVKSPVCQQIWYEDCDHGFAGFEEQTAEDVLAWLTGLGMVQPASRAEANR